MGEIYCLPAFASEYTLVDINDNEYSSADGNELISNSLNLEPFTNGTGTTPTTAIPKSSKKWVSVALTTSQVLTTTDGFNFYVTADADAEITDISADSGLMWDGLEAKIVNASEFDVTLNGNFSEEYVIKAGQICDLVRKGSEWLVKVGGGGSAEFPTGSNGDILANNGTDWVASNRLTTAETDISDEQNTRSSVSNLFLHFWDSTAGKWLSSGLKYVAGAIPVLEFLGGRFKAKSFVSDADITTPIAREFGMKDGKWGAANASGVWGDFISDAQPTGEISANTTLDNTYHNGIFRITANVIITVPSTLRNDFNCVFDVIGAFAATFTEGGSVTFSAPYGKILPANSMCSLVKIMTSPVTYRLNGNLIV